MKRLFLIALAAVLGFLPAAQSQQPAKPFYTGAEVFLHRNLAPLQGMNVAVVANQSSLVEGIHLVDTLLARGVRVTTIFCPEHGFRGTAEAGIRVPDSKDSATGIPIVSLYGDNKKPTPAQLKGIGLVLFDLQDVGCRFYTYVSTLHYVMEACAENDVLLAVLDRPNPNGHYVDGPVLDTAFRSFVGMHPVPVVYGMTLGEYSQMINGEGWLKNGTQCRCAVYPMAGYRHDSLFCRSVVLPVPPSPNLRTPQSIALYPSLCLFEGTTVSVGRGTPYPFEAIGIPIDRCSVIDYNARFSFAGLKCWATNIIPNHFGFDLRTANAPSRIDLSYLQTLYQLTRKGQFFLKNGFFDRLAGTDSLRIQLERGASESEIRASWKPALTQFKELRQHYLLYP